MQCAPASFSARSRATESAPPLNPEVAALMYGMTTIDELAEGLVHSHPTLSELLQTAAKNAE